MGGPGLSPKGRISNTFEKTAGSDPITALAGSDGAAADLVRATMEALPDPVLVFDATQRVIFANSAATSSLGEHDMSLDRPFESVMVFNSATQEILAPDQLPVARALAGESVGPVVHAVRPIRHSASFWFEFNARLAGTGVVLVFRDITLRKNRELALESGDQLRDFIYKGNLTGILHTTVDGRIIDCNDAIVRMFGYASRQEMRGVRAQQLYFDPAQRDRVLRLVTASPDVRELEVSFRRRDNTRGWALLSTRLLDPRPGEVGGTLVTTFVDITERKLWEESLRRSQRTFTAFMSHLPGVAFIKDLTGKYIYYNEASWTHFQKHPEDLIGKTDEEIWPAEDAARHRTRDAEVIETGRPIEFVEPVTQSDGVHSWLVFKFPIVQDGKTELVGGIGIDITERRTLEDQLTQARKMEALGRLAGGVAHDFNNLLTVISGYGQLTLEGLGTVPVPRLTTYVQEVLNSARRASGLTGQLLAFSRRQTAQPKVFDLCALLRNMERLLQRMIGEHVELSVRSGSDECLIRADPHQMEQVLLNLAVNARDAMPLGGTLDIECGLLPEPLKRSGLPPVDILLEVKDTGVGMDEAVKARMFEPFFTSKNKGKGTGLGLSTAYGVISQAGGEIEVDSAPGQGSRFRIYFPSAVGEVEDLPPLASEPAPAGLETVLLVEDEESVRALAETVLKKLGYKVLVAGSGKAALEIWQERSDSIDVLLTDVIMPHMSGGELAHKLRADKPHLKILFMSGYTDDMITSHGVLVGETQLLQKPFTAQGLGRKLRDVLDA